jgi:hypothetical protein
MEHLNLNAVRAAYLRHIKAGGEAATLPPADVSTGKSKLYASDFGGCKRKAALRITEAKKRPTLPETDDNLTMKFFVGNTVHDLTYLALEWAGLLITHERRVSLPEPFGGRFDCIYLDPVMGSRILWDGKTVRSNQLADYRDELPKPNNVAQICVYAHHLPDEWDVCCLEYIDQAGSNSPEMCFFTPPDKARTDEEIAAFIAAYEALPELPDRLAPEVYITRKNPRKSNKETDEQFEARRATERRLPSAMWLRRQWLCGYCDYRDESCQPLGPDEKVKLADFSGMNPVWTPDGRKREAEALEALKDLVA